MSTIDTEVLSIAASRGREAAIGHLLTTKYEHLRVCANTYLHDYGASDDVVQEAFVRLVSAPDSLFQEGSHPFAWMCTVIRNLCINLIRDSRRRTILVHRRKNEWETETRIAKDDWFSDKIVQERMRKLNPDHRTILLLFYQYGYTYSEIAKRLRVQEGTVMSRLSRARAALREELPVKLVKEWGRGPSEVSHSA